jgi:acrylyl-CoA reductase (NADPH)
MGESFNALVLREAAGKVAAAVEQVAEAALPDGDVTVRVAYSTLNYKDGMVVNGLGRLVRDYPHVPGIDFAGTVERSDAAAYKPGDRVVLTGWRVGELHWGGYAQKARVKAGWLVPLPGKLTEQQAMCIGTAGFTAMLCVMELEAHGVTPDSGPVLVTGANGGVGSVAVALLAKAGYEVHAATGRIALADRLKALGAAEIVPREELAEPPQRPLLTERWAGAVDAVGGNPLAALLPQIKYGGAVAACGLSAGTALNTTVIPFLLRGVRLLGVDSVMCPLPRRKAAWARLADDMTDEALDAVCDIVPLAALPGLADSILKGETVGRIVVDVNA